MLFTYIEYLKSCILFPKRIQENIPEWEDHLESIM